jgi:hypothetical protein
MLHRSVLRHGGGRESLAKRALDSLAGVTCASPGRLNVGSGEVVRSDVTQYLPEARPA